MITKISVHGLGKLGASMAAGFASRGFQVIGVDINPNAVTCLNEGRAPVQETGLEDLISANQEKIRACLDPEEAVANSEISFVIVPTPSDDRGAFTLQYARHAFKSLGQALRKKNSYHVVVMTSTVLPGATRYGLLPILEEESGKKCGRDFGLCYNPEFIALGSVIRDFLNPDFYLLGQFDERSGNALESVHQRVSLNQAPVKRMSLENAELAKISVNSFVTMKISFANMLANFCQKIPGGDVDVVSDALGMDKRIGRKYLTGGFGFGGPCFPRDNIALDFMGKRLGVDTRLLRANDEYNRHLAISYLENFRSHIPPNGTVAVLGLAYKPDSHVVEESPGIYLCRALADAGYRVIGHDPLAGEGARQVLGSHALVVDSLDQALKDVDVVLVCTPDNVYRRLEAKNFSSKTRKPVVIDFWRILAKLEGANQLRYIPVGKKPWDENSSNLFQSLWEK
jgi:UDPglucose 6-dehydrogenase